MSRYPNLRVTLALDDMPITTNLASIGRWVWVMALSRNTKRLMQRHRIWVGR